MKTPEEWEVELEERQSFTCLDFVEIIRMIQTEAYNQALDDLMNEVEKSSFSGDMKETIRQMTEILKK